MKKILLFVFLISTAYTLFAQNGYWQEAKGPDGGVGFSSTVKTSNGQLYAIYHWADPKHIYKSDDGGLNWALVPFIGESFPDTLQKYIRIGRAGTFFVNLQDATLGVWRWYKSSDEGEHWSPMDSNVREVFETPNGVLIAERETGIGDFFVWRSVDGGVTWTMPSDIKLYYNTDIFTPDGEIATYWVNKLTRSQDDGLTWTTQTTPQSFSQIYFTPSGTILGKNNAKVYRSTDNGATFDQVLQLPNTSYGSFTALNSGRILLQSVQNPSDLNYSDDDGQSWATLPNSGINAGGVFLPLTPLSDGTIFKTHLNALLRSSDGGLSWQFSGNDLLSNYVEEIKFVSDSVFYALTQYGLWGTHDKGENWQLCTQSRREHFNKRQRFALNKTGNIAVINDDSLLLSSDFGQSFTNITPPTGLDFAIRKVFLNPVDNALFVNTASGLMRSTDLGQSWELVVADIYAHTGSMAFLSSGSIIANCMTSVLKSLDGGETWVTVPDFAIGNEAQIATVAPNGDVYLSRGETLWKSKDGGETWAKLPIQLISSPIYYQNTLEISSNGHLYLLSDEGLLLSVDEGYNWQSIAEPFPVGYTSCSSFALTPGQKIMADFQGTIPRLFQSAAPITQGAYIEGHARIDADADCSTPDAQEPLKNWIVEAEGESYKYYTHTNSDGHYILFVDTGNYQVTLQNPNHIWWAYCDSSQAVTLPEVFITDTADFAAIPLSYCPLMTVNVGIPQLDRCFDNEVYVEYCNRGTEPADSAWVDIMLDPYLSLVSSAQPYEDLGGNTIRFFVGDVPSGECGQFQLTVHVDCDSTVLGQTHCVMAHGFPDTLCTTVPTWSGANIEASVTCQDSTLLFHLKNTGNAHSQTLDYIIIEDEVVLMTGQRDYDIAEDVILDVPANGSTWRIESEQEPGHPFSTLALAFAEGCGGFNSLGFINQFSVNGIQPSWHRMCVENTGSFDPNDKQGFPTGTGDEHNIRPGQTLDYLIRFQNTGTDTAFSVEVRDTLSVFLDPLNLRPGASSHPYTWSLSGQGVIRFTFSNIMLPDSNVNESASHGFVQFSIAPYVDVPLGSVIENSAAIYFDFNEPVITNTTWHTIQKSPLSSTFQPEPSTTVLGLEVWPNPFDERTNIRLEQKTSGTLLIKIFDSRGTLVGQKTAIGPDIELNTKHLPSGLYWAEIRDSKGKLVGNGKLVKE